MIDWRKYEANFVRTQTVDGQRLVLIFANDFKQKFNREICISCESNFKTDFKKYINSMNETKSLYKLKQKYDGILLGFGKKGRLTNDNMNDKDALFLIKNHPKGKELFDFIPEIEEPKTKKIKGD
jgi:hypothetical protein